MFETVSQKKFGDCHTGRSGTVYHNAAVFFFLAGHTQTIDDTGQNNDGGSVLVIMKYRDIKHFFQTFLDFETTRSGDVFQIDTAESGSYIFHSLNDLFGVLGVQTDRYSVNISKFFE